MADTNKKKQQMEYIAVAVLSVIAIFIAVNKFAGKTEERDIFPVKLFTKKPQEAEETRPVTHEKKGVEYTAIDKRTPFKSPLEEKKKKKVVVEEEIILPAMIVQGMIWNSPRPQAVIDKKIYNIDDIVNGAKIEDVTKDGVHLNYKGKEFVIRPKDLINL